MTLSPMAKLVPNFSTFGSPPGLRARCSSIFSEHRIAFRKKIYATISELQKDLDVWMMEYNEARPHQGRYCFGKMPMQTFLDARTIAQEKQIGEQFTAQLEA